jgi:hypothetical protein
VIRVALLQGSELWPLSFCSRMIRVLVVSLLSIEDVRIRYFDQITPDYYTEEERQKNMVTMSFFRFKIYLKYTAHLFLYYVAVHIVIFFEIRTEND